MGPMASNPCQPLTMVRKYYSFPQQVSSHTSLVPSKKQHPPRSYWIDARGKWYCRCQEHIHPLQQDLFKVTTPQLQEPPKPTCIPKPNTLTKPRALPQPPKHTPSKSKSHIPVPHLQQPSQPNPTPSPSTLAAMVSVSTQSLNHTQLII